MGCRTLLALVLAAAVVLPPVVARAEPGTALLTRFKLVIRNDSPYRLTPGGYVVHDARARLYRHGEYAPAALVSLCETGHPNDFVFHVRKSELALHARHIFEAVGGARPGEKIEIIFPSSPTHPFLSFAHKVGFTDDTCVGASELPLFDERGAPLATALDLVPFDVGTRRNVSTAPPAFGILAQLKWSGWEADLMNPQEPVGISPFLGSKIVGRMTIEPLD